MLKIKLISLGCAKNLVDSEVMAGILKNSGHVFTDSDEEAEVIIINTCGFIDDAKEESVYEIIKAAQQKKIGSCKALIVTGCLAQRYYSDISLEIPEVDGIIGTGEVPRIAEVVQSAANGEKMVCVNKPVFVYSHDSPRIISHPTHSAYIKIAEGCNNRCTYCVIPELRGDYRSRDISSILCEARHLVDIGVKEINLIAQDTTAYGKDIYGEPSLDKLLRELIKIDGLPWIRILYAYPTHFTQELIDVIAKSNKICKYLDIPLQHSDINILKRMNRRGSADEYLKLIEDLRRNIPDISLRTSFIVGFPGETQENFKNLVDFVKTVRFDRMGVFTYSPQEGTRAFEMPGHVIEDVKEERKDCLMKLQQEISLAKNREKVGKTVSVLIEKKKQDGEDIFIGRTEFDAPDVDGIIYVRGTGINPGEIIPVKVTHAYEYDLIGDVIV